MAQLLVKSVTVGQGKPVILLHAFPLSHQMWRTLQPRAGTRFIFPDFPGFGLSPLPRPIDVPDFTLLSQSLEQHLIDLGVQTPFTLGGISMGGYWAMEFARLFPNRIEQLLLISTRAGVDKPEGRSKRLQMADQVEKEGMAGIAEGMVPGLLGKTTLRNKPQTAALLGQWLQEAPAPGVALAQRVMASRRDQSAWLPNIKVKAHVWAGQEDAMFPNSESQTMAQAIPDSELKIFEGAGHLVPLEDPDGFQRAINQI